MILLLLICLEFVAWFQHSSQHRGCTLYFEMKNCQTNPPGTLNVIYILAIHPDNAQVSFVLIEVCQSCDAVINFSKIAQNQNKTVLLL